MLAMEITQPGGPEVLQACERPRPSLHPGQVLIKVHAAGVNRPDLLQRIGKYPVPAGASDLPGLEVAGEIVAGHPGDSGFHIGDQVCALVQGGGYAQYCAADIDLCLPIPRGLSMLEAASLPETYFTVWSNVYDRAHLAPAETLLVQGGTSGIGVAAVQLAAALGNRVFATAGTDEKCQACVALGADRAINYRTEDFAEVIKEATRGKGVDVILDMVGGSYVQRELSCLADDGRLVFIALLGGARVEVGLGQVLLRRLTVTGSTLRPRSVAFKADIARKLRERVWPLIEDGLIKPVIYRTFPMQDAAQAHALMETSAHVGKVMLLS
jgi:NADPH2:quinone reductase